MKVYNAKDVHLVIDGRVVQGFQPNDMFTIAYDEDRITMTVDAQGNVEAAANNARMATLTVNLSGNSADHKRLAKLANANKSFKVSATTGYEKITGNECFVTKLPNTAYGKGTPGRTYTIKIADCQMDVL